MTEPNSLIAFGHSHVWSLRGTANFTSARLGRKIEVPLCGTSEMPGPIIYFDSQGKHFLSATLVALLNRLGKSPNASSTWLLSAIQGNFYNQLGMLTGGQAFDFVLPSHEYIELVSGTQIIPHDAIRAALLSLMSEFIAYLPMIRKGLYGERTIILSPPPPPESNRHIADLLKGDDGINVPTEPSVRLKLWILQESIYLEQCKKFDLHFLSGGLEDIRTKEGYLQPTLVKDAVHANHLWADKVFEHASQLIKNIEATK